MPRSLSRFLCLAVLLLPAVAGAAPAVVGAFDADALGGELDYGWLNHPLAAADRVVVRGPHFMRVGADGIAGTADDSRVRFFGVNLSFGANFPEPADAARIARRLRSLGVNLVRLHHLDSAPDEDPALARSLLLAGKPFPTLAPQAVQRLRHFLDALAAEGIHANLNLHVGYRWDPLLDGVPAMPGGRPLPAQGKPLQVFHPRMVAQQEEYLRSVVAALRLAGDPVLAQVEINNESSLLFDWQVRHFADWSDSAYYAELRAQWIASGRPASGFPPEPPANDGSERARAFAHFLAGLDRRYLERLGTAVRALLPGVPVTGTQAKYGGAINLWTHAGLDYIDQHFYIDHYMGEGDASAYDPRDWYIRRYTPLEDDGIRPVAMTAALRDRGKPLVLSEFNLPWPNPAGPAVLPVLGAVASAQDWDGLVYFSYARGREWDRQVPAGFELLGDHSRNALVGTVAAAWRQADLPPLACETVLALPYADAVAMAADYERPADIVFHLHGRHGYDMPAGLAQSRFGVERPASGRETLASAACARADFRLDEARMVATGRRYAFIAGDAARLGRVTLGPVSLRAPVRGHFVTAALRLLEGDDWAQARRLLLVAPGTTWRREGGRVDRLAARSLLGRRYALKSNINGEGSVRDAQGEPHVDHEAWVLSWPADAQRVPVVHALGVNGERIGQVPVRHTPDGFQATVNGPEGPQSFWFELSWR